MIITANLLAIFSVAGAWNVPSNPSVHLRINYQSTFVSPVSKTRRSQFWMSNRPDPPNDAPPPPDDNTLRGDDVDIELEQDAIKEFGANFSKTYVAPIFSREIVRGVPSEIFKGALVTGASLPVITGKGILLAGVTGLGAVYVATTPGPTGDGARVVGKVTWSSTQALLELSKRYDVSGKIGMFLKAVIPAVNRAIGDERFQAFTDNIISNRFEEQAAQRTATIDDAVTKIVKEAEDTAMSVQSMLEKQKADQMNDVENEDGDETNATFEEEVSKRTPTMDSEITKIVQEAEDIAMSVQIELDEQNADQINDVEDEDIDVEVEDEDEDEINAEGQYIGEDDWNDSVQLADRLDNEVLIDNEIVTEDDQLSISFEAGIANEEELDAARDLAESLMDQSTDISSEPEMTLEELGKAARAAVEQFEMEQQKKKTDSTPKEDRKISTSDIEVSDNAVSGDEVSQGYENMTVVKLKDILRSRGLKVSGRKADLIMRLKENE